MRSKSEVEVGTCGSPYPSYYNINIIAYRPGGRRIVPSDVFAACSSEIRRKITVRHAHASTYRRSSRYFDWSPAIGDSLSPLRFYYVI